MTKSREKENKKAAKEKKYGSYGRWLRRDRTQMIRQYYNWTFIGQINQDYVKRPTIG
jgi:hypothetical protein